MYRFNTIHLHVKHVKSHFATYARAFKTGIFKKGGQN